MLQQKFYEKPVLLTGGAGFIGSYIVDYLSALGIKTIVLDTLITGRKENLDEAGDNCRFVLGDACDAPLVEELIKSSSLVIHLAAVVGMKNVHEHPLETLRTNIDSVRIVAEKCGRNNVPLIFFSSSSVYHINSNVPGPICNEKTQIHYAGKHHVSLYAESKLIGESICETFHRIFGLEYLILRPFNMIGSRQSDSYGMVVPNFLKSAINDKKITIFGDGTQTRTFSHIEESVGLMWKLISNPAAYGNTINLATNNASITINELAKIVGEVVNEKLDITYKPYKEVFGEGFNDVMQREPALDLLKEFAGTWEPKPLKEVIEKIYRNTLKFHTVS